MERVSSDIKACLKPAINSNVGPTTLSVDRYITLLVYDVQIEIFIRSFSSDMDVETCREMSQHAYCAAGTANRLVSDTLSGFDGRFFSQEDSFVLEQILGVAEKMGKPVKIYDLSKLTHKLTAAKRGIFRTPVVVVDKVQYESLEDCLRLISVGSNP